MIFYLPFTNKGLSHRAVVVVVGVVVVGVGVGEMVMLADPVEPWKVALMDAVPGEKPAKKSI
jgi:hypothetical protein